jgi:glucose-6-phosphate 1-dehydrogenase
MTETRPISSFEGVQLIECPPRREAVPPGPCAMVVFGASGDLTSRLLVPALYNLSRTRLLPDNFALIGVARSDETAESWRDNLYGKLKSYAGSASEFNGGRVDEEVWNRLAGAMSYVRGDLTKPELYQNLRDALSEAERTRGTKGNVIFYLAVAEQFFCPAIEQLKAAGLTDQTDGPDGERRWRRVVFEKPFGHSLKSARDLNAKVLRSLSEDQIFRIDHFLGKETVQNIMALRFANGMFEPIWNRDRVDHVQITVSETVGVESRGSFYEATGALRDMVPNHVLALVSMVAMEPPGGFDAASIRSKKAEVFTAMRAVRADHAVRAQYAAGTVLGKPVMAYRDEPDVARDSKIETYVAMQIEIDNWRWAGVPFYIRTGKHMSKRKTEIAIRFKQAPFTPFQNTLVACLPDNWLIISIAPDEGISLQFAVKRPGPVVDLASVRMDFRDNDWFPHEPNVGYETLIYDVMMGDQTLFMRADMVEEAWRVVQPVLDAWEAGASDISTYVSGSEGPLEADGLLAREGKNRAWRPLSAPPKRTL